VASLLPVLLVFSPLTNIVQNAFAENCNTNYYPTSDREVLMNQQKTNNKCVGLEFYPKSFILANNTAPVRLNITLFDQVNPANPITDNEFSITIWNFFNSSEQFQSTFASPNNHLLLAFQSEEWQSQVHSVIPMNAINDGMYSINNPIFSNGGNFHAQIQLLQMLQLIPAY
jgi:hypothetical protein